MRRSLALSSLAVAAASAVATPAAHAYPVCARVVVESRVDFDSQQTCMAFEYGVICHTHFVWDRDLHTQVWVYYCVPRPLP